MIWFCCGISAQLPSAAKSAPPQRAAPAAASAPQSVSTFAHALEHGFAAAGCPGQPKRDITAAQASARSASRHAGASGSTPPGASDSDASTASASAAAHPPTDAPSGPSLPFHAEHTASPAQRSEPDGSPL